MLRRDVISVERKANLLLKRAGCSSQRKQLKYVDLCLMVPFYNFFSFFSGRASSEVDWMGGRFLETELFLVIFFNKGNSPC